MRIILPLLVLISFNTFSQLQGNSEKIHQTNKAKFPLASGSVQYEITGDATGSSTLYFDRNGWRSIENRKLQLTRYGITSNENIMEFTDGDYAYKGNIDAGKGQKSYDQSWSKLLNYKSKFETIEAIMTSKGASLSGTDVLLNKICNKWIFTSGTTLEIWEWEGIPLKIKKKLPGVNYELNATSITESISIPDELFVALNSVEWIE